MSTPSPATTQMVTEHAIRIVQKLSPAMKKMLIIPEGDHLADVMTPAWLLMVDGESRVHGSLNANTACALIVRDLMGPLEYERDEDGSVAMYPQTFHKLTELGVAVRDVLMLGEQEALQRAIAADEDDHDPLTRNERLAEDDAEATLAAESAARDLTTRMQSAIMTTKSGPHIIGQLPTLRALEARGLAKVDDSLAYRAGRAFVLTDLGKAVYNLIEGAPAPVIDVDAELPVEYSESLHEVLIMTSHRRYRIVDGDVYQGSTPNKLASETDMIHLEIADKAGLIEERMTLVSTVNYFQLTALGMRVLLTFDAKYGRSSMLSYAGSEPPREVLVVEPTKAVVAEYSEYYISGPGRLLAEKVGCGHGYRLTDSCPVCP